MAEEIPEKYYDVKDDLLFAILLKLGGTVEDVEQIYPDKTDDLLYAILKKIAGTSIIKIFPYTFTNDTVVAVNVIKSETSQHVSIGTAPGASDIFDGDVEANIPYEDVINTFVLKNTTWYVTAANPVSLEIHKI